LSEHYSVFSTAIRVVQHDTAAPSETLLAHNEGRKAFYREAGVEKVQWLTADDGRTCTECAPLNGKVFPINELPALPVHVQCRCTVSAVVG
jgi:SPP1 gp7 family putative phage head morphogenesis protein